MCFNIHELLHAFLAVAFMSRLDEDALMCEVFGSSLGDLLLGTRLHIPEDARSESQRGWASLLMTSVWTGASGECEF